MVSFGQRRANARNVHEQSIDGLPGKERFGKLFSESRKLLSSFTGDEEFAVDGAPDSDCGAEDSCC